MVGSQAWKLRPFIILALRRLREENCLKFEASLSYTVSFKRKSSMTITGDRMQWLVLVVDLT